MLSMHSVLRILLFIHIITTAIISNENYHIECTDLDSINVKDENNEMAGTELYRIKREGENTCPDDFILHNERCYGFRSESLNWHQSRTNCQGISDGYDLVVINSKEENEFLKQQIESQFNGNAHWIGLRETTSKDSYDWIDGSDFTFGNSWKTDPWKSDGPSDLGKQFKECVYFDHSRQWADSRCGKNSYRFICEGSTIEPCATSNGGCEQTCTNDNGQAVCSCVTGILNADGTNCDITDPCTTSNGGCEQTCTNNNGQAVCSCTTGILNADGTNCDTTVDCVWGAYDEWSSCSATCGGGTRTRTRAEDTAAANGGAACSGSATETESCNSAACPDVGGWQKDERKFCTVCIDRFDTFEDAKSACEQEKNCKAVYDLFCDGIGTFCTCKLSGIVGQTHPKSLDCIYRKGK